MPFGFVVYQGCSKVQAQIRKAFQQNKSYRPLKCCENGGHRQFPLKAERTQIQLAALQSSPQGDSRNKPAPRAHPQGHSIPCWHSRRDAGGDPPAPSPGDFAFSPRLAAGFVPPRVVDVPRGGGRALAAVGGAGQTPEHQHRPIPVSPEQAPGPPSPLQGEGCSPPPTKPKQDTSTRLPPKYLISTRCGARTGAAPVTPLPHAPQPTEEAGAGGGGLSKRSPPQTHPAALPGTGRGGADPGAGPPALQERWGAAGRGLRASFYRRDLKTEGGEGGEGRAPCCGVPGWALPPCPGLGAAAAAGVGAAGLAQPGSPQGPWPLPRCCRVPSRLPAGHRHGVGSPRASPLADEPGGQAEGQGSGVGGTACVPLLVPRKAQHAFLRAPPRTPSPNPCAVVTPSQRLPPQQQQTPTCSVRPPAQTFRRSWGQGESGKTPVNSPPPACSGITSSWGCSGEKTREQGAPGGLPCLSPGCWRSRRRDTLGLSLLRRGETRAAVPASRAVSPHEAPVPSFGGRG